MSTISNLLGAMPSLLDYLPGGSKAGATAANLAAVPAKTVSLASALDESDAGDTVSLSTQAQSLLAAQNMTSVQSSSQAKAEAQNFLFKFFQSCGVDLDKLSGDANALLQGIAEMTEEMGDVTHDTTMDSLTASYKKGQRESYTLHGDNQSLSFTIQYENGKPSSLAVLQVEGTAAIRAVITMTADSGGRLSGIHVSNSLKEYTQSGELLSSTPGDTLDLSLYA